MSEFAEYTPARPPDAAPAVGLSIDDARPDDAEPIARLTAEREGGAPEEHRRSIEAQLADAPERCRLFVARLGAPVGAEVVAFARVSRLDAASIPAGWYFSGLIVSPAHRRRGIGRALTEHRIQWLSSRTDSIYYFASARNRATIDLHAALGFREVRRGITVPGCTFDGGVGVLYGLRFPVGAPSGGTTT